MAKRKHLINVHTSTGTTAPTGASLYLGEIAVQHKATDPALWIKVGAAESSTQYEKFVGEKAVTSAISQAVSSSLTGVSMNGSEVGVTNKVATLGTVITAETQLSTATTGTGNVVGSIGVSNHKITTTMFSAASADQISKLSGATTAHTANTTMHVTSTERTRWNNAWTSGVSAYTKVEALSAATTGISDNLNKLSAGTIALVASSAATVFSSAKTYTDNEIGKLDSTGQTSDASHYLTSVTITNGKITAVGEEAVPSESSITTATSGGGNVISNITATGHQLTLVKSVTAATSAQVSTLSAATHSHVTNGDIHVTAAQKTNWTNSGTSGANAYVGYIAHSANTGIHVTTADKNTWNGKQDAISDLSTIRNNAQSGASAYTRVNDLSAVTLTGVSVVGTALPVSNHAVNVPSASSSVFGVVKAGSFLTSSNGTLSVSTGTGSNNVARGDHSHSNYATTTNLNALSAATTAHTADTTAHVTSEDKTLWNAAITGVTSAGTGNAFTDYSVSGNKLTLTKGATYLTTAATTTQGTRADNALQIVSGSTYIEMSAKSGGAGAKMQTATVKQQGVETASATGQGLADAYDVKQYVESLVTSSVDYKGATATLPTTSTVGDMYITTAQIALTAAQSATGAAQTAETGDFIIARSSGKWDVIQKNLDGAITGTLTADTVTLGNGTHTAKSLANGSNGTVLAVVSNKPAWTNAVKVNSATTADSATNATNASKVNNHTVNSDVPANALFTDSATTETGHYTPSTSASTKGTTAATANYVKGIRIDSKNHVIDVVTGTVVTAQTQLSYDSGASVSNNASAVMTGLTVSNHAITYGKTNKVFSAGTADSAATLTGNITTGQVTNLTTKIQTTKVNSATTADSASNATKVNNHTVESDVPSSAVFTDTATTQTGHYTPSASASTEGSTTGFIKQIKLDSKKHVVGIVSGTTSYTETSVTTQNGTTGSTAAPVLSSITTGGTKGHELTLNYTNKVNSATTANSAVTSTSATTSQSADTSAALTGNITTGQVTNLTTKIQTTKVNSATTADSATNATNATNAVSATTSQSANTAAALTGNITTGQVTNLTTKIQTTKVNSATTADSATSATNAVSATTSLSANVATNATKVNNHTVNSDVPSNAVFTDTKVTAVGNHYTATTATKTGGTTTTTADWAVKGITYDAAGHIVSVISGSVLTSASDTATTEEGHYSPTTSASTKGTTAATANYVKGIRIDSKNHVIDVVTGTVVTAQTQLSTATTGTGNVVCGLTVSNHKITTLMFSAAPADALVALSAATTAHTANTTAHVTSAERTRWNDAWTSGVSAYTKVEQLSAGTLYELNQTNHNIPYVIQSGNTYTGSTYAYVAETNELTELVDGQSIIFHPKQNSTTGTTNGSASTCSLSIKLADGTTTTPRPIYLGKSTKITTHIQGCSDIKLTYHDNATWSGVTGLCGWWVDFYYADGNTVPTQLYGMGVVKSDAAFARYALAMQTSAGTWNSVVTSSTSATTHTATTKGFLVGSDIIYYSANLAANTNGSANSGYVAISSLDFRYSSNAGSTLTAGLPVYLVGTVNPDDGLFYLDSTTWWSQSLPTVDNGKVYIYVGNAISAYQIALHPEHPIYEYKGGHVRLYQEGEDIEMILGSGYTYSGIPYVNSATSIAAAYSALTNELLVDEEAVAASLNDLNARITSIPDCSAGLQELSGVVETNELVTAHALNDLNSRINELSGSTGGDASSIMLTGYHISCGSTEAELTLAETDSVNDAFGKIQKQMLDNEEAIAASLNDLNARVSSMSSVGSDLDALSGAVKVKEFVIAQALNDLNDKVYELSGATVSILPPFTAADAGKVLSINSSGQLVWISLP